MSAAFVEAAEHFVIFQTEYLDPDDQAFEPADEQVSEDHADPVGMSALRAGELQNHFHDRGVADGKSADTDERDRIREVA